MFFTPLLVGRNNFTHKYLLPTIFASPSDRVFSQQPLFLTRSYERVELVFIRHHVQAKEVDEEEFFHSRETGGTLVSPALEEMRLSVLYVITCD